MALSRLPPPVVADAAMLIVFSSAMEARILLYCRGGGRGQCLHYGSASGGYDKQGAKVFVKLFHEGGKEACDLSSGCSRHGGGCDILDNGGGVCRTEGVAAACCQSLFLFKSFMEG